MRTVIQKEGYAPVFIAALFTIAKLWKQPKYPLINEWIKKNININRILFSHKKE